MKNSNSEKVAKEITSTTFKFSIYCRFFLCNPNQGRKLEIWYVSTHIYLVLKNAPFSTQTLLILLMSAYFFTHNQHFFVKNSTLTQSNSMRAELYQRFLSSVFSFYKINGRRVTRRGDRGERGFSCPFSKIGKDCPNLEKKMP